MKTAAEQIQTAIENKKAQILTIEKAKELKGKRIITMYFGYNGQDGTDDFIVGDLVLSHTLWGNQDPHFHNEKSQNPEYHTKVNLLTQEGKNTHIFGALNNYFGYSSMFCSDLDREVYFIEA